MQVVVREIADPGEAASALDPTRAEIMPTGSGQFARSFVSIDFPRLQLRSFRDALPILVHVKRAPGCVDVGFLPDESLDPIVVDGLEVNTSALVQFGSERESTHRSFSQSAWANFSVSHAELDGLSSGIGGHDFVAGRSPRLLLPSSTQMRRLRALHSAAVSLARQSPELISEPEVLRSVEATLIGAMADCLSGPEQRRHSPAQLRHAAMLRRFRELLDANLARPLYLPEVCGTLSVSHRTLSYFCQDFLGMPPKRYFFLRRMHIVRQILLRSGRHETTVTEVATCHGFWEFGRFAVQYKRIFDETPSATLRRDTRNRGAGTDLLRARLFPSGSNL